MKTIIYIVLLLCSLTVYAQTNLSINWNTEIGTISPSLFSSNITGSARVLLSSEYNDYMNDTDFSYLRIHSQGIVNRISDEVNQTISQSELLYLLDSTLGSLEQTPDKIIFCLAGPPEWMNPGGGMLARSLYDDYAAFCATVAGIVKNNTNYPILYWEPINELEDGYSSDINALWDLWIECAQAIKSVDSNYKLVGPAATWPKTKLIKGFVGYVDNVDSSLLDAISWHQYNFGDPETTTPTIMSVTPSFATNYNDVRNAIDTLRPNNPTEYFLGEYNISWSHDPSEPRHINHIGTAWFGSVINHLIRGGCVNASTWHLDGTSFGLIGYDRIKRPSAYLFNYLNKYLTGTAYDVSGTSTNLEAIAARSAQYTSCMIINKEDSAKEISLNFGINDYNIKLITISEDNIKETILSPEDISYTPLALDITLNGIGVILIYVERPSDVGLWHFDGDGTDQMDSGSSITYGANGYFDNTDSKFGSHCWSTGATGNAGYLRISLDGMAKINNDESFGISFWVKPSSTASQYRRLISFGDNCLQITRMDNNQGGSNRYSLDNTGLGDWGNWWELGLNLIDDQWHHVAITADGTNARLFVDNTLKKEITQTGSLNGSDVFYLGAKNYYSDFHDAMFDELLFSNAAADSSWVNAIYTKPVALWHLDGDTTDSMSSGSTVTYGSNGFFDNSSPKVGAECWSTGTTGNAGYLRISLASDAKIDNADKFGISFWVKPLSTAAQYRRLISFGDNCLQITRMDNNQGGSNRYSLNNTGLGNWGNWWKLGLNLIDNQWHHVAITADGTNARLFVDNTLKKEITQTGPLNGSDVFYLGARNYYSDFHDAEFDELIFISNQVSQSWVNLVYSKNISNSNITSSPSDCQQLWEMGMGYPADIDQNCEVNLNDINMILDQWMECNNPTNPNCAYIN